SIVTSGTVQVTVDSVTTNVPITNGTGSLIVDGDSVGTFAILASYLGDASHFNPSSDSTNHEVEDTTPPDVQISQGYSQDDPTNVSPILFDVYFDEAVTGFTSDDISFTGSTAPGTLVASVTGSGDTYTVSVSGMTDSGTVVPSIPANSAIDPSGNGNTASYSNDNSVTYDITDPTVTINQAAGQADPTASSPILFDVEFSEPVTGFTASDVSLTGSTAPGINMIGITGSGTTYQVTIDGMTGSGTVVVSIPANSAVDQVGNNNEASTSTDNEVNYDVTPPTVTINQASTQSDPTNGWPIVFDVEFSEPVTGFSGSDVDLTSSTAPGTLSAAVSGSGTTYQVSVSGMTDSGLVIASIPSDSAVDAANNGNEDSTSTDNSVTYDVTDPTVTIEQAATQIDPTRLSPINFEVTFDEPVTGFDPTDIDFTGSTAPGTLSAAIGGTGPIYNVLVSGMTDSGLIVVSIRANAVVDASGNTSEASTSTDNSVTYDVTPPTVTINQGSTQSDPTNTEPIVFDVIFSEEIIGFEDTDLVVAGMVNPPVIVINGSGDTYTVEISGLTDGETVTVDVSENSVVDNSGNENSASTSTDNSVSYDITSIQIMESGVIGWPGNQVIQHEKKYTSRFNEIEINFDSDANDPSGDDDPDDVTNPENYYLLQPGDNGEFDVENCTEAHDLALSGLDDIAIPIGPVTYENNAGAGPFIATLTVNNGTNLPLGKYRLMICGSTTIMDLAENPLNDGDDVIMDFTLHKLPDELPLTGFNQGSVTTLPEQPLASTYNSSGMVLTLPGLGVSAQIVGVPLESDGWNTSWLGNDAGYLEGSAFPTTAGNTVITGHIWTSTNKPGIFLDLNTLRFGDEVRIYAWGRVYTYKVISNYLVSDTNVSNVMQSETADWLTLLTCDGYDPETGTYAYRRVVRAILVNIE
ncbi:MAG: sortase, partial [Anaerolineaceae bacterium]|nr:sortase [Anaerolineaceae bacterium]